MKSLNLTEEEATLLVELLQACVSDLRMEIADTDSPKFKDMLRTRKQSILDVLSKLGAESGAPTN